MSKQSYKIRYSIEPFNDVPPEGGVRVQNGVRVTPTNYGYTDVLFCASIILKEDGSVDSILLMDSEHGIVPNLEILELVRDQINHQLEYHL